MKDILIIFDLDWAPEPAIVFTADILRENHIKSTWFLTHQSAKIDNLQKENDLFEFGLHPNFLPNSTHGDSYTSILDHMLGLYPEAQSIRSHAYHQSSSLLNLIAANTKIIADLSIFLPHVQNIQPFKYFTGGRYLYRIPVYWEDDYEIKFNHPEWQPDFDEIFSPGLKVLAFHPIHVYLNSVSMDQYKKCTTLHRDYQNLDSEHLQPFINQQRMGVRDYLMLLMTKYRNKINFLSVSDLLEQLG